MKDMKKWLAIGLALMILVATVSTAIVSAGVTPAIPDDEESFLENACGEHLTWALSSGTLTISGTGDMAGYSSYGPWYADRRSIRKVVIGNDVTSIGNHAFFGLSSVTTVTLPNTLTKIGDGAFQNCSALPSLTVPAGVTYIGYNAFSGCDELVLSCTNGSAAQVFGDKFEVPYLLPGESAVMTEMVVASSPKTAYAIGESLDTAGLTLTVSYDGGATKTVSDGFTVTGFDSSSAGTKTLTVAYRHLRATYQITVQNPVLYGDANNDGDVDIKDVVLIRQYIVNLDVQTGISSVPVYPGADANGDGDVDIKDVVLIRQYIVNLDVETGISSVVLGPQK